ncbi:MAG: recombinase family protein [Oscillospiraceae bacterium]|nr:recombinase family protein [Oscillospiraceae bacterium]
MKGVIYARYSSDNQREESIEGQLRECKDYAERNGITILGTYIDRALSAKTDNRPEFQKMIKDSAKGLFDVVLVWKLDRFARNRYDSARYKNLLKKNGVKVISARENISEGSEGIILEAMLEGYAEYYSAELSEKVIRGLTDNALKCKYNGGTVPMGYYIDEQQFYQIDPKTAPVVLEMFTKYSEGATMQELVNLLNSRGMRSIRGGKITLNIMNHLLKNRRYMGEYSYRDVVKEDGIPAIVPKELFERVQERLAKNKKAPARHKAEDDYLLTTKLYCGKCGSFMVGESGTSHTMKVHRYYRCVNTKKKKLCDKKAVKKDWIEDLVVNYTMKAIMNDEVMERLIDTLMELQKKESTDLPLLKKQLAETEKGINNMLNAIQAGIFTPSTKQRLDELEETKSQLEVSILQEEMHKPLLTREQIAFFIYRFRKFDVTKREQRQRLIDSFVNAVYLYEDKIILTFNYKDGSKTITLADVEGSDLSSFGAPRRSKDDFAPALFCKFSQTEKARRFKPTCFLSCKMTLKLFSADRQSRRRGLRQNRRRGLRQNRRRGFHRSHRLGLRQNRRRGFHRSLRRGLCCQSLQTNRPSSRVVSAAGAGGDCRRSCRRYRVVSGRPNGAGAESAGDGVPRRWDGTPPSECPCRASCSGGDSGDNACHQA